MLPKNCKMIHHSEDFPVSRDTDLFLVLTNNTRAFIYPSHPETNYTALAPGHKQLQHHQVLNLRSHFETCGGTMSKQMDFFVWFGNCIPFRNIPDILYDTLGTIYSLYTFHHFPSKQICGLNFSPTPNGVLRIILEVMRGRFLLGLMQFPWQCHNCQCSVWEPGCWPGVTPC